MMRILISSLIVILTILLYIKSTHSSIESYLLRGWTNSDHRYRDIPFKTHIRKIRRPKNPLDLSMASVFDDIPVEMPDVTDRHTLLQLAQMTSNAYIKQGSDEWIEPSKHFSGEVISFGWKKDDDGLRGHIFSTPDKKTVVIAIKGTSAGLIGGGGPSSKNDKFNVCFVLYGLYNLTLSLRITYYSVVVVQELVGHGHQFAIATTVVGNVMKNVSKRV